MVSAGRSKLRTRGMKWRDGEFRLERRGGNENEAFVGVSVGREYQPSTHLVRAGTNPYIVRLEDPRVVFA
jgi:hypothetical protein